MNNTPNEQPDAAVNLAEQRLEFAHVYNRELAAEQPANTTET